MRDRSGRPGDERCRADGDGGSLSPAMEVVEEIKGMGGEAVADGENVADIAHFLTLGNENWPVLVDLAHPTIAWDIFCRDHLLHASFIASVEHDAVHLCAGRQRNAATPRRSLGRAVGSSGTSRR